MFSSLFPTAAAQTQPSWRLWVDTVGVFLIHRGDQFRIGSGAGGANGNDLPLLANLSRQHALLFRRGEDWWFDPQGPAALGNRRVTDRQLLTPGSELVLGNSVRLGWSRPSQLSGTARLDFLSDHRPAAALDSVILMSDVCVLGRSADCHIRAPRWSQPVFLLRRGAELVCRAAGGVSVNQNAAQPEAIVQAGDVVSGEWFRFRIE